MEQSRAVQSEGGLPPGGLPAGVLGPGLPHSPAVWALLPHNAVGTLLSCPWPCCPRPCCITAELFAPGNGFFFAAPQMGVPIGMDLAPLTFG